MAAAHSPAARKRGATEGEVRLDMALADEGWRRRTAGVGVLYAGYMNAMEVG